LVKFSLSTLTLFHTGSLIGSVTALGPGRSGAASLYADFSVATPAEDRLLGAFGLPPSGGKSIGPAYGTLDQSRWLIKHLLLQKALRRTHSPGEALD